MEITGKLLLAALKSGLKGERFTPEGSVSRDEWQKVINLSWQHHLLPLIFEAVYDTPGIQGTPIGDNARRQARQAVVGQTRKTTEFLELNRRLRGAGVTPLVVKGLVCRELYRMPDHRISGDEDVLIPQEQYPVARRILEEFGMTAPQKEISPERIQEIPWRKPGSPLFVELHLNLFPPDSDAYGDLNGYFKDAFCRAEETECHGERVLTMCPTDHLFYLICHAFKHFLHAGFGIRQVCDIVLFGQRYDDRIDWAGVRKNCREIRADWFTAALFAIGKNHLDLEHPRGYARCWQDVTVDETPMLEDLLAAGVYGSAEEERLHSSNITLTAAADQKSGKTRRSGLLQSLFPSADSLKGRYPYLQKAPVLLPVAWVSRVVGYGRRHGKAAAASASESMRIGSHRVALMRQYGILDE